MTKQTRYHKKSLSIELPIIMERFPIIMRLKWKNATQLIEYINDRTGRKDSSWKVARWINREHLPNQSSIEPIFPYILEFFWVPASFFFYKVDITMINGVVTILIPETNDKITFNFFE